MSESPELFQTDESGRYDGFELLTALDGQGDGHDGLNGQEQIMRWSNTESSLSGIDNSVLQMNHSLSRLGNIANTLDNLHNALAAYIARQASHQMTSQTNGQNVRANQERIMRRSNFQRQLSRLDETENAYTSLIPAHFHEISQKATLSYRRQARYIWQYDNFFREADEMFNDMVQEECGRAFVPLPMAKITRDHPRGFVSWYAFFLNDAHDANRCGPNDYTRVVRIMRRVARSFGVEVRPIRCLSWRAHVS